MAATCFILVLHLRVRIFTVKDVPKRLPQCAAALVFTRMADVQERGDLCTTDDSGDTQTLTQPPKHLNQNLPVPY